MTMDAREIYVTALKNTHAVEMQALQIMEAQQITSLAVVDDGERVQGVVHLHDLWRTELV